jgi:hypothetical protein
MDFANALKAAIRPNFLLSLVVGLVILGLVNGLLPADYKISKLYKNLI